MLKAVIAKVLNERSCGTVWDDKENHPIEGAISAR
jgi:hypothetical protein